MIDKTKIQGTHLIKRIFECTPSIKSGIISPDKRNQLKLQKDIDVPNELNFNEVEINDDPLEKLVKFRGKGKKTLEKEQTLMDEMCAIELKYKTPEMNNPCQCSKSKCLKMYCECFTSGYYCDDRCNCTGCCN